MEGDKQPGTPWYRSPFWLAVVGLALMVGGYRASTYVPESPPDRRQADKLAELRGMTDDEGLRERLDDVARNAGRQPPFRWPGRIMVLVGAMMCVSAVVIMARQPSRPPREPVAPEPDEPAEDDEEDASVHRPA